MRRKVSKVESGKSRLVGGSDASRAWGGDHDHSVAKPAKGELAGERGAESAKAGYRPGRKTQQRRQGKKQGRGSAP